jgi:hypothetical protein
MKYGVGICALLLLVTTLAFGQSYQPLPFPQEANTALQSEWHQQWTPSDNANLPSSMAADQSAEEIAPEYVYAGSFSKTSLGSPFPSVANPGLGLSSEDQMTPSWEEQRELGSPFPSAANPAGE